MASVSLHARPSTIEDYLRTQYPRHDFRISHDPAEHALLVRFKVRGEDVMHHPERIFDAVRAANQAATTRRSGRLKWRPARRAA